MAREFRCPARKHDPCVVVWLEVMPRVTGRKAVRPWCRECIRSGGDSVLVASDVQDFYPGSSFPLILTSLEEFRHLQAAREAARDSEARYAALEPCDSARQQELEVLQGTYYARTTQRLLGSR